MTKKAIVFIAFLVSLPALSQDIDIRLLRDIYTPETVPSDKVCRFISDSHIAIVIGTPTLMYITGIAKNNGTLKENAIECAAASILDAGAAYVIKHAVNRERPYERYPDIIAKSSENSSSFPSGHTASAFATATSISLEYPKWYVIVPSYLWAGSVAYSRMHLGMHYPSDVLGGMILGAGSAYITYKVNKWLKTKRANKR